MAAEVELSFANLRILINDHFRTDADLEAFFIDHFPSVAIQFSRGMERTEKINLLFSQVHDSKLIAVALYKSKQIHERNPPQRGLPRIRNLRPLPSYGYFLLLGIIALICLAFYTFGKDDRGLAQNQSLTPRPRSNEAQKPTGTLPHKSKIPLHYLNNNHSNSVINSSHTTIIQHR